MKSLTKAKRGLRGFTIPEAMVTVAVFSIFLGILFFTMEYGFRAFSVTVARSDVTTEARRLNLFLDRELRSTDYFSVAIRSRNPAGQRRDGFSFVSVADWNRPDNFDVLENAPRWSDYILFYATTDQPSGKLIRTVLKPQSNSDIGGFPYPPFAAAPNTYMPNDPSNYSGADIGSTRVLATKVKSFRVTRNVANQQVSIRMLLRQNGVMSKRADRLSAGGTFELHYIIRPENSS